MSAPPTEPDTAPAQSDSPAPPSTAQTVLGLVASGLGLAYLWLVIGRSIWMQYTRNIDPPIDWLRTAAWLAIPVIAGAILSRRLRWQGLVLGALIAVWMGAGAVSSWRLTGQVDTRSVMLGAVCAGLFVGVAAARPAWPGGGSSSWAPGYVFLHLAVYYKSYYSLGQAFPGSTWWWSRSMWHAEPLASVKDWQGGFHFVALDARSTLAAVPVSFLVRLVPETPHRDDRRHTASQIPTRTPLGCGICHSGSASCLAGRGATPSRTGSLRSEHGVGVARWRP